MRRLCLTLLVSLFVAVPAALASPRDAGDGTVAGSSISGVVTIAGRGVIWGVVDSGQITVTDRDPTDGTVKVSGYDGAVQTPSPFSVRYAGSGMRFQLVGGGVYRLSIVGSGISFSAVGAGKVMLDGADLATAGKYKLGDDPWQPVPTLQTWFTFPAGS